MDIEDQFCEEVELLIFETASAFRDCDGAELNNTATPPLDTTIRAIFQDVKCWQSLINSMPSLLFFPIVALVEAEADRQHVPNVDFREFHELEAQKEGSLAKIHM